MKIRIILSSLVLFIFALGFNALLTFTSLNTLLDEFLISKYLVVAKDLQRSIERNPVFEASGVNWYRLRPILEGTVKHVNEKMIDPDFYGVQPQTSIAVIDKDGDIIISSGGKMDPDKIPQELWNDYSGMVNAKDTPEYRHSHSGFLNYISLPLHEKNNSASVLLLIIPDHKALNARQSLLHNSLYLLILVFSIGVIILVFSLHFALRPSLHRTRPSKKRISVTIFLVIICAQIIFSGLTAIKFRNSYLKINKGTVRVSVELLKEEVESELANDLNIEKLRNVDSKMKDLIATTPEIADISLFDRRWQPIFVANREVAVDSLTTPTAKFNQVLQAIPRWNPDFNVRISINRGQDLIGYISANISRKFVHDKLLDISMDSLTVLIISLLFFVEMLILITKFLEKDYSNEMRVPRIHYGQIRPIFFLLLFGIDFSISFVPLHMENLYVPIFGLSKDIVLSLPVSLWVFFAGMGFFISGAWNDRRGWHEPFLVGVTLAGLGYLCSWFSPNAYYFIIAQIITGLGYGLAFMASQGFIMTYTDEKTKAQGFASLFAALYAGGFCGSSTGAMLAERIGYRSVFFLGAIIIFSTAVYAFIFMRDAFQTKEIAVTSTPQATFKWGTLGRFLIKRNVMTLILFSSIPANMAMIGFLNYFNPLHLSRIGITQSNIGRTFMIYCALSIYVGPWISKFIDASDNKKGFLTAGGVLGSMAFITYFFFDGFAASIIAILLLGFSQSFVFVAQAAYLLKLRISSELGQGKAIATFRMMNYLAQVLGPIIFGWMIINTEISIGMTYLGLGYLVLTVLFILFAQKDAKIPLADQARPNRHEPDLTTAAQRE